MVASFRPMLSPTQAPQGLKPALLDLFVKDSFTLPTLLALGACLQAVVMILLPARYSLLPLAFLLGRSAITTILQAQSLKAIPIPPHIIPGRVTAQLPSSPLATLARHAPGTPIIPRTLGESFGVVASATPMVTFHLGIRFHHPLGLLSPGARQISAFFQAMTDALEDRRDELGVVSLSIWRGTEEHANNAILLVAYFRRVEDLNRFAHDPVHRDGWDWYHRFVRETGHRHFGLFHETFLSRPGEWETIYMDCPPTLLGAGSVRIAASGDEKIVQGEESGGVEEAGERDLWIRPVVSADHPALKSQAKRMGMTLGIHEDVKRNEF